MRLTRALLTSLIVTEDDMMHIADAARDIEHVVYALQDLASRAQTADNKALEFVMDRLSGDAMLVMDRLQTIVLKEG